jgi:phage recombination protein Bet
MSTSTEIATSTPQAVQQATVGGALALSPSQTSWTPEQLAVVKQLGLEQATEGELKLFLHVCQQTGLDPFARQIYGIMRNQYNPVTRNSEPKLTIQTGIDGFRLVASRADRRTGEPSAYEGREGPLWCGRDGVWTDVWTADTHPYAAKVGVYKRGFRQPLWATVHYSEYVQTKRDGTPTEMWRDKPATMLSKCAEAAALRGAFPQDLSSVYAPEEMAHVAAQTLASRTVEASPMRSDEEQAQWDDMAAAERALDGEKLKVLYRDAAHAKNDLLVAAITAAGYRVQEVLAKQAANKAADDLAAEQAADDAAVDAEVVSGSAPPVADPKDRKIPKSTGVTLGMQLAKFGAGTDQAKLELAREVLHAPELTDMTDMTVRQAEVILQTLAQWKKDSDARIAAQEAAADGEPPTDDAR